MLVIQIALVVMVGISTHVSDEGTGVVSGLEFAVDPMQYQHAADAILARSPHLLIDAPDWLAEIDNPFDPKARAAAALETGWPSLWDYAYYNGNYYSYFGVLPALLLFLPYKVLTGTHLSNMAATIFLSIIVVLCTATLTRNTLARYGRNRNVRDIVLFGMFAYIASGVVYLVFYPSFYHEAILSGLACALGGVSVWIHASSKPSFSKRLVSVGSLLVALTLVSRPPLVLVCLLAIPLFWQRVFLPDQKVSSATWSRFASVVAPFLIIGILAMWWNYIRFGNPFDFGSNYNLTGFDMTGPKSEFRVPLGIIMYIFSPLNIDFQFPFFSNYTVDTFFFGWLQWRTGTIIEPYYGGIIAFLPLCLICLTLLSKNVQSHLVKFNTLSLSVWCLAVGIGIMLIDSTVAVTQRYQSDFFWLFVLATMLICLAFDEVQKPQWLYPAAIACVSFSGIIMLVNLMAPERYCAWVATNPELWQVLTSLFS
ncbi:hypothetical protein [Adlercreutzia sp. ZJ138]|uniref:hypothetical protein n=1 Tax=Adlercreutzia sp. ZJ138 TaxID=2709405 RepID=UPI0013ED8FC5|nr:hypothetical protein [Adlercreutzia sp. ZJ138]